MEDCKLLVENIIKIEENKQEPDDGEEKVWNFMEEGEPWSAMAEVKEEGDEEGEDRPSPAQLSVKVENNEGEDRPSTAQLSVKVENNEDPLGPGCENDAVASAKQTDDTPSRDNEQITSASILCNKASTGTSICLTENSILACIRPLTDNKRKPVRRILCKEASIQESYVEIYKHASTSQEQFECFICQKSFLDNSGPNVHMHMHKNIFSSANEVNPVQSTLSKETSTQESGNTQMRIHKRTLTSRRQFECYICEKRFCTKRGLLLHMCNHNGEKHCSICLKSFMFKKTLLNHRCIHTVQKPFKCSFCHKRFILEGMLRRHMRNHYLWSDSLRMFHPPEGLPAEDKLGNAYTHPDS